MRVVRHLPNWLYEVLPYVYIGGSFVTAVMIRNLVGMASAMLLLSAGALVLTMRHSYRASTHAADAVPVRESAERNGEQGAEVLQVAWRPAFEIGHDAIDRQHQRLLSLGNGLITALMQGSPQEDVDLMLDVLADEIGMHLKLEDELLSGHNTPLARRIREAHRGLLARVMALRDRYRVGEALAGDLVGFIAYDLIAMHIAKEDLRFALGDRSRTVAYGPAQHRRSVAEAELS